MRVVAALLALVVVAGCGGDPHPKEPKPSASASSASITPPTMPAQAKENSPEGAAAFARYFVDILNFDINGGTATDIRRLSDEDCKACGKYVSQIVDDHAKGGEVERFHWTVTNGEVRDDSSVALSVNANEYRTRSSRGSSWTTVRAAKYKFEVALSYQGSGWIVNELFSVGSEQ